MNFKWNEEKNKTLKIDRGIGFEDVMSVINENKVLDIIEHPNIDKYPTQSIYIVGLMGYVYMVPFVVEDEYIFLKTIIPSRKMNKIYNKGD